MTHRKDEKKCEVHQRWNCIRCPVRIPRDTYNERMKQRSRQNRAEVLGHLVEARRLLLEYSIYSDWDFGVDHAEWWKACMSVTNALTALDWHRR